MEKFSAGKFFKLKLLTFNFEFSFLPQIALKSTTRKFHQYPMGLAGFAPIQNFTPKPFVTNGGPRQTKLATITEQQTSEMIARNVAYMKSPHAKSPAKKIAKHEISTPVHSALAPMKKLKPSFSKVSVKRDRF